MSIALPFHSISAPWLKDELSRRARAVPSLDLQFANRKSLVDAISGQNLVTFTRASGGTYVDSQGVIRNATTNLLLRSEEFNDASWVALGGSVATNNVVAPSGLSTADTWTATAGQTASLHQAVSCAASTTYTWSFWARMGTLPVADFRFAVRDDSNGAFIAQDIIPSVTPVTTEWRRISYTFTTPAGCVLVRPYLIRFASSSGGTIHFWGAQLEQSSTVGEYIPTGATINSAPRFDHNPTTGESLGLLVEEQRTNSIRNNTMQGAVAGTPGTLPTNWYLSGAGIGTLTQQVVGTGTSNGINYVDIRYSGTSSNTGVRIFTEAAGTVAASSGQNWTASAYIAILPGSIGLTSVNNEVLERNAASTIVQITSGANFNTISSTLTRLATARTLTDAATVSVQQSLLLSWSNAASLDFTLRIGLPQLEQGAFATSVIPTFGTAATRNADVASITGTNFSSWYRQDEGTFYAESVHRVPPLGGAARRVVEVNNGSEAERLFAGFNADTTVQLLIQDDSVIQANLVSAISAPIAVVRFAAGFALNNAAFVTGGGTVASDTSCTMPTPTQLMIGYSTSGGNSWLNSTMRRLTYWSSRLPNTTLQSITQ